MGLFSWIVDNLGLVAVTLLLLVLVPRFLGAPATPNPASHRPISAKSRNSSTGQGTQADSDQHKEEGIQKKEVEEDTQKEPEKEPASAEEKKTPGAKAANASKPADEEGAPATQEGHGEEGEGKERALDDDEGVLIDKEDAEHAEKDFQEKLSSPKQGEPSTTVESDATSKEEEPAADEADNPTEPAQATEVGKASKSSESPAQPVPAKMYQTKCPKCNQMLNIPSDHGDKNLKCPECGELFRTHASESDESSEDEDDDEDSDEDSNEDDDGDGDADNPAGRRPRRASG